MASEDHKRTVVLAIDASKHSQGSFNFFMDNVYRTDDFVVLVHIPEAPTLPTFSFKSGSIAPPIDEWKSAIETALDKVHKLENEYEVQLIAKKVSHRTHVEHYRSPGEGIIRYAEKENAQLIVMGTRGLDPLRRTLLGSVSDYVVRHSHVPVLICPLPAELKE